jgi:HJR/Mrr/RecB family endonuclease
MNKYSEFPIRKCTDLFVLKNGTVRQVVLTYFTEERGYRWVLANEQGDHVADVVANSGRSVEATTFTEAVKAFKKPRPKYARDKDGNIIGKKE